MDGGITEEVWDMILYLSLGGAGPSAQQQIYQAHLDGDGTTKEVIHWQYFCQTCDRLFHHDKQVLDKIVKCEDTTDTGGMGLVHKNLPVI